MVEGERPRHPPWLRAVLAGLQAVGLVVGLVVGTATYRAWSDPGEPVPTTTTAVVPETAVPPTTLG
jgi:hypothetical protein